MNGEIFGTRLQSIIEPIFVFFVVTYLYFSCALKVNLQPVLFSDTVPFTSLSLRAYH